MGDAEEISTVFCPLLRELSGAVPTYPWTKPMRLPRVGLLLLAKRAAAAAALSGMPAADGLRDAGNVAYGDPVEGGD